MHTVMVESKGLTMAAQSYHSTSKVPTVASAAYIKLYWKLGHGEPLLSPILPTNNTDINEASLSTAKFKWRKARMIAEKRFLSWSVSRKTNSILHKFPNIGSEIES